jgi:hypothetical protein
MEMTVAGVEYKKFQLCFLNAVMRSHVLIFVSYIGNERFGYRFLCHWYKLK